MMTLLASSHGLWGYLCVGLLCVGLPSVGFPVYGGLPVVRLCVGLRSVRYYQVGKEGRGTSLPPAPGCLSANRRKLEDTEIRKSSGLTRGTKRFLTLPCHNRTDSDYTGIKEQ